MSASVLTGGLRSCAASSTSLGVRKSSVIKQAEVPAVCVRSGARGAPCGLRTPASRIARNWRRLGAVPLAAANGLDLETVKESVIQRAANIGKREKESDEYQELQACINNLKALSTDAKTADYDLKGSNWKLLYSDSKGPSGGRIGPFTANVEQAFSPNAETLVNSAQIGPLKVSLNVGYAKKTDTRLTVTFAENCIALFGGLSGVLEFTSDKQAGRQGYWEVVYADDDLRVLYTNAGTLFVLTPCGPPQCKN